MAKVVSVIPAKPVQLMRGLPVESKKRVCAYCRVSTDTEEQLSSYEAQVSYYDEYIEKRPDWEFAGIYADEGITGTNTKNRADFNRMIDDCLAGRIDLIVTCLSCTRTFSVSVVDILRTDYLSCTCCGRPVPADLLDALKRVGQSLSMNQADRSNESLWHIRIKSHPQTGTTKGKSE